MSDPLTQVAGLIRPSAPFSKITSAAGEWRVSRSETGRPFYIAILEGQCWLSAEGHEAITLETGDFILIPAARDFSASSVPPPATTSDSPHMMLPGGEVRIGEPGREPDWRALVGYCVLGSSDASLLLSLLPKIIHVRGERRLATLVELVWEEARADRPGKEIILSHLLEVLFIEAMRSTAATVAAPGLLRGLADERIAVALRQIHNSPERSWTVERLAKESALSRSAFFDRFQRVVGLPPMEYLASWRMALAKDMLRRGSDSIVGVAERSGYSSTNSFSTAFKRQSGQTPARYALWLGSAASSSSAAPARAAASTGVAYSVDRRCPSHSSRRSLSARVSRSGGVRRRWDGRQEPCSSAPTRHRGRRVRRRARLPRPGSDPRVLAVCPERRRAMRVRAAGRDRRCLQPKRGLRRRFFGGRAGPRVPA